MMCDADIAVLDEIMEEATDEVNATVLAFLCGEVGEAERDAALARWKRTHAYWMGVRLARRAADDPRASA
ncbi:hypothetical protein [Microvirga rosea]|uniref:hypothetical protein n=1 Tax=Microvirga rosea TaxID=2715425 RepID=UPI001D0B9442|nr:hypothetical protein [Microvirga rosea]MCB8822299.1 hypothetical protein [Microvirga rosea]